MPETSEAQPQPEPIPEEVVDADKPQAPKSRIFVDEAKQV